MHVPYLKSFASISTHQGRTAFIRVRLRFSIAMSKIEQRHVIKVLYAKKFVLGRIGAELASAYGEHASAKKAVERRIHEVKLRRSDMGNEAKHGRPPLDDVDARILACLSNEPFSSIRSIVQALGLAPATVH
jgi:hypothetical protein